MEISIQEVVELQTVLEIVKKKILPMKTSYKFARLFKAIEEKYTFYQTQISLLISEYSEKDDEGNPVQGEQNGVKIQADKINECQEKINELLALCVEIPDIKFTFEEVEPLELTVEQFMCLIKFCEE